MPGGDWLYAYGTIRCKNPKCRNVYRDHYEFCNICGAANPTKKKEKPGDEEEPTNA